MFLAFLFACTGGTPDDTDDTDASDTSDTDVQDVTYVSLAYTDFGDKQPLAGVSISDGSPPTRPTLPVLRRSKSPTTRRSSWSPASTGT